MMIIISLVIGICVGAPVGYYLGFRKARASKPKQKPKPSLPTTFEEMFARVRESTPHDPELAAQVDAEIEGQLG